MYTDNYSGSVWSARHFILINCYNNLYKEHIYSRFDWSKLLIKDNINGSCPTAKYWEHQSGFYNELFSYRQKCWHFVTDFWTATRIISTMSAASLPAALLICRNRLHKQWSLWQQGNIDTNVQNSRSDRVSIINIWFDWWHIASFCSVTSIWQKVMLNDKTYSQSRMTFYRHDVE